MANWPPLSADRQAQTMKIDLNQYFRFVIPAQAGIQTPSLQKQGTIQSHRFLLSQE